jgi:hypothetical protein
MKATASGPTIRRPIIARRLGYLIHCHPPENESRRAFNIDYKTYVYGKLSYLNRNKAIVYAADVVLGCPKGREEELRSGTWSTMRYAHKLNKPRVMIFPDGSMMTKGLDDPFEGRLDEESWLT